MTIISILSEEYREEVKILLSVSCIVSETVLVNRDMNIRTGVTRN